MPKLISIVIPAYNEEQCLPLLYRELKKVTDHLSQYDFEFIFVDDGSRDGTARTIKNLGAKDPRVKLIEFSRNFGKEVATTAGIKNARGDAAVMMDADLQHPPNLLPRLIREWERGGEVVIGVRSKNSQVGLAKRIGTHAFYRISSRISYTKIKPNATDYRLLDRVVVDAFKRFTEHQRITRGLVDWLGFRRKYVDFEAPPRKIGKARYHRGQLVHLAVTSFISHSFVPLKIAGYLGLFITVIFGLFGLFLLVEQYILGDPLNLHFSGTATLAVLITFLVGIILSCLGLIALYIGKIHHEVANRPLYVIRRKHNF